MSRLLRLVAVALMLALPLSGCSFTVFDVPLPGGMDEETSLQLTADFDDALNVVPRTAVMVDDVPVGQVVSVERIGWTARVTMLIRKDVAIPGNAKAEIRQTSLLGEKFVSLEPPAGAQPQGRLADGTHLKLDVTGRNPEVEEVLGALSTLLSGGGVAQLGTITKELNLAMSGRTPQIRQVLNRLDQVVTTIDGQKGDIVRTLEAVNKLTRTLNAEKDVIGQALTAMGPAVDVISEQTADLVAVLRSLDRLSQIGTDVIEATRADIVAILRDLHPVATRLTSSGDSLARGLSLFLSFPFPKESNDMVFGDYANTNFWLEVGLQNKLGDDEPPLGEEQRGQQPKPGQPAPVLPQLPDLPLPDLLPDRTQEGQGGLLGFLGISSRKTTTTALGSCLASPSIVSEACAPWLQTTERFIALAVACDAAKGPSPVCRVMKGIGVDTSVVGNSLGAALDPYSQGLTTAFDSRMGTGRDLYSGGAA